MDESEFILLRSDIKGLDGRLRHVERHVARTGGVLAVVVLAANLVAHYLGF